MCVFVWSWPTGAQICTPAHPLVLLRTSCMPMHAVHRLLAHGPGGHSQPPWSAKCTSRGMLTHAHTIRLILAHGPRAQQWHNCICCTCIHHSHPSATSTTCIHQYIHHLHPSLAFINHIHVHGAQGWRPYITPKRINCTYHPNTRVHLEHRDGDGKGNVGQLGDLVKYRVATYTADER